MRRKMQGFQTFSLKSLLLLSSLHYALLGLLWILPITTYFALSFVPLVTLAVLLFTVREFPRLPLLFLWLFSLLFLSVFRYVPGNTIGENVINLSIYIQIANGVLIGFKNFRLLKDVLLELIPIIGIALSPVLIADLLSAKMELVMLRSYTWTNSFFLMALFGLAVPSIILSLDRKVSIRQWIFLLLSVTLYSFHLKRVILLDLIMLLLMWVYFNRGLSVKLWVFLIATIGSMLLVKLDSLSGIVDALISRLQVRELVKNGRDVEVFRMIEDGNILSFVFGTGVFSWNEYLGHRSQSVHSGWFNYFYKYGFVVVVVIAIKMVDFILNKSRPKAEKLLIVFYGVKLFLVNYYWIGLDMLILFALLFKRADFEEIKSNH